MMRYFSLLVLVSEIIFATSCRTSSQNEEALLLDADINAIDVSTIPRTEVFVMDTRSTDGKLVEIVLHTYGRFQGQDYVLGFETGMDDSGLKLDGKNLGSRLACREQSGSVLCTRNDSEDGGGTFNVKFLKDPSGKFEIVSNGTTSSAANAQSSVSYGKSFNRVTFFEKTINCSAGGYAIEIKPGLPGGTIGTVSSDTSEIAPHLASLNCTERYSRISCGSYGIFDSGFSIEIQTSDFRGELHDLRQGPSQTTNISCSAAQN